MSDPKPVFGKRKDVPTAGSAQRQDGPVMRRPDAPIPQRAAVPAPKRAAMPVGFMLLKDAIRKLDSVVFKELDE